MIKLTDAAALKVRQLIDRESPKGDLALRVAVQQGGCAGLRYALYFDDQVKETDVQAEYDGVRVVTDKMSAPYLAEVEIDFVDTLQASGFKILNPNAQSTCACGDSFH